MQRSASVDLHDGQNKLHRKQLLTIVGVDRLIWLNVIIAIVHFAIEKSKRLEVETFVIVL